MMTMVISGSDGVTFPDSTTQNTTDRYGFVNRIINGDMRIDQRNAGASVTLAAGAITYTVDRFLGFEDTDGAMTAQQDTSAPAGFVNSLKFTTTTADASLSATQRVLAQQRIEGTNVADLGWGTANAKTVTLSFWVRSSLTGTFGGALQNNASTRTYPFTYSISTADTWEYKTVTIAGDTSGTWLTTTGVGIQVNFGLGVGSTYSGTAGSWAGADYNSATGAVSVVGTLNATWYITGVQLEVGSVATPFERRPYGAELMLCQRYYYRLTASSVGNLFGNGFSETTSLFNSLVFFPVEMRAAPSALEQTGTAGDYEVYTGNTQGAATAVPTFFSANRFNASSRFTRTSSLTAGNGGCSRSLSATAYLGWSAEL
jgi:hypothetical protein